MKAVTGIFHDEEQAAKAIEALGAAGVPTDEISVMVMDASGLHEVPVEETSPVLKGALAGGAVGAALVRIGEQRHVGVPHRTPPFLAHRQRRVERIGEEGGDAAQRAALRLRLRGPAAGEQQDRADP